LALFADEVRVEAEVEGGAKLALRGKGKEREEGLK